MANLLHNDTVARALSRAIASGDASMESVPGLLRRLITENMWQKRIIPESGEVITFERFEDFVLTDPLEGLGTTMDVIEALCKKQEDVLVLLRQVRAEPVNPNGGDRRSDQIDISNRSGQGGTSTQYTINRLMATDPALAQRVINREVTAAEARRIAGWEKEKIAIRLDDPQSAAQTILKRMDKAAIAELLAILADAIGQRE